MAFTVSSNTVARLLHQMGYSLRVNHKKIPTDSSPDRDQQFRYSSDLRQRFHKSGLPIISVDTRKRELIGNFKNSGACWGATPTLVNDHDFRSDAAGIAIPHGVYDVSANRGHVTVGISHDTAAFAVGSIARWWQQQGASRYSGVRQLLLLADTGGSNGIAIEPGRPNCSPNRRFPWSCLHGCTLSYGRFQMESH